MAETKAEIKTEKKLKIDTSWSGKKRTERLEFRCSKNLLLVIDALIAKYGREYSTCSKADLMVRAIKEMAEKEKLLLIGDNYYL